MTAARSLEFSRRKTNRVVGGVAGGLADTLGVPDAYVRAAFLTLLAVWGLGGVLYLGFWLMAYDKVEDREVVEVDNGRGLGLGLAFLGLLLLLGTLGWWPNPALVLTAGALAFGTAALTDSSKPGPLAALMDPNVDRPSRTRLILGVVLLFGGLSIFIASIGPVSELGVVFLAIMVTGLGIVVAFGPWVRRLIVDLGTERNERIRQEERAEMAAHLHDSVLQTLALIQRTDDPARMAILARHQETELRDWLFGAAPLDGVDLVSTALRNAAARVEKDHQVPIDVVTVGDHLLDKESAPLIGAASEAMVNAAKHSGADRLSLYLEAEDEKLTVYVTDQGKGFDLDKVAPDRKGIAESIKSRVENAGGTVEINSEPGDGTEVVMRMPVESG
ncbi:MAG: PspC domain-containing protein [Actinobacteria bacterium]|nr:PspC domain-containing protein [Actinomycetota bacterium]MCZ6519518.1 PspC domain-containing protein [Actinomycetota bacterium]MCZ6567663.1 PspC domain-containing protein [Actinomycetota bacterium]MCZ6630009.1 PspC domain-containing protein [Actinomycetota bacterium]